MAAARILVVDDEPTNVQFLQRLLAREGFSGVIGTTNADEALHTFRERGADLVLLDLHMVPVNGMEVLAHMRALGSPGEYLPIVFLSGDLSPVVRREALAGGATDFLTKPFDAAEVMLRIRGLVLTRFLYLDLQGENDALELRVADRTAELEESRQEIFDRLCRVAAYRDDATSEHTKRVGRLTEQLALALGQDREAARLMGMAAELHDLGKVGVPDEILYKPGRLTDEEMAVMRRHASIGAEALSGSHSRLLQLAERIAREHHERWDGTGYPNKVSGESISLAARIVAVVDVWDALAHDRPYRPAWAMDAVAEEIRRGTGSHFDPAVAGAFLACMVPATHGTAELAPAVPSEVDSARPSFGGSTLA